MLSPWLHEAVGNHTEPLIKKVEIPRNALNLNEFQNNLFEL